MFGILVWGLLVVFYEFISLLKEEVHVLGESWDNWASNA